MATGAVNIGMMSSAYFVGRNDIISWINSTLHLNVSRLEEAATGAIQCQMLDMIHPGIVPMHKVNFDAKTEYDMIQNYKILQEVFDKLRIEKHIDVNKLIKGRPLDNLEFLQWLMRYCDTKNGGILNGNYNPEERRCKGAKERNTKALPRASKSLQNNNRGAMDANSLGPREGKSCTSASEQHLMEQVKMLSEKIVDLKLAVDNTEKERDFYFSKLRDVEILCQRTEVKHLPMTKAVWKILYAVDAIDSPLAEAGELTTKSHDRMLRGSELKDLVAQPCS